MTYDENERTYTLSSGREFSANRGIIGIGPDCGADGVVPEGYDGGIVVDGRNAEFVPSDEKVYTPEERKGFADDMLPWTKAERAELAQEMIRRWMVFGGFITYEE
jgi:hypothetical protein